MFKIGYISDSKIFPVKKRRMEQQKFKLEKRINDPIYNIRFINYGGIGVCPMTQHPVLQPYMRPQPLYIIGKNLSSLGSFIASVPNERTDGRGRRQMMKYFFASPNCFSPFVLQSQPCGGFNPIRNIYTLLALSILICPIASKMPKQVQNFLKCYLTVKNLPKT